MSIKRIYTSYNHFIHKGRVMKEKKEYIVLGMALFAMFFGAGNLIFPPSIGNAAGENWIMAMFGFLTTGVGLPLLGIMAFNKVGSLENFASKVSKKFNIIYCSLLIISLGPLLAIPRTGATTYEMGIQPVFGDINPGIVSFIYFSITLAMVLNPSKIIDNVGKILTPIILLMLAGIILKGSFIKIGTPVPTHLTTNPFSFGFLGGYQTMDALASILMGAVIMNALVSKGYTDRSVQKSLILKASAIAGIGLASVYGGLLYLGATSSSVVSDFGKTKLTMFIAEATLGNLGNLALGLCVSAACLTTSVGLVTIVGDYFSKFGKFTYRQIVTATCIFSGVMAIAGVDTIVKIAAPILVILYPVTIVLIVFTLLNVRDTALYKAGALTAVTFSFIEVSYTIMHIDFFKVIYLNLPFSDSGFSWLIPTLGITTLFFTRNRFRHIRSK